MGFTTEKFKQDIVILETRQYNGFNELVHLYRDGYETRYIYRPDGLRHKKQFADGTSISHLWDGQNIVAEYADSGNITARYLRGINLISREQDSQQQYYLYNAHGDVVQRTDQNGTALKNYEYDAFGCEQSPEVLDVNPFRYCGEYYDREADTLYLRARSYNASIGRFTAEDSAMDGLNWYTYCLNNPIRYVDITGNKAEDAMKQLIRWAFANPAAVWVTQNPVGFEDLFYWAGFTRDSSGVYHTRQDALQRFAGYNDIYDAVFDYATSMRARPFEFSYDGQDYSFWAWKGDYLNLGAGAELGIYTRLSILGNDTDHWLVDTSLALPMTMTLSDTKGNLIASYSPEEPQWWITSFNPYFQNVNADELKASFTIDFSGKKDMFNAFYRQWYNQDPRWTFDRKNYKVTLNF